MDTQEPEQLPTTNDVQPVAAAPTPGQVITPQQPEAQPATTPEPVPATPVTPTAPEEVQTPAPEPEPEEEEPEPETEAEPTSEQSAFSWQASEYIYHQKNITWYLGVGVVMAILVAAGIFVLHQWLTVGVFVAMTIAIVVYGIKQPRTLNYTLDDKGITIEGKPYPYTHFRSFAVLQDVSWHSIDLEPTQRFMPRLSILFDSDDLDSIVGILAAQLPREDRAPDTIERLARYLHF